MLSRVVETIYWMARYVERAEDMARLINVNSNLLLDLPKGIAPGWRPLLTITGCEEQYNELEDRDDQKAILRFLIGDPRNTSAIISSLTAARENARTIRDVIPREAWEQINSMHLYARDNLSTGLSQRGRFQYLREVISACQLLTGMLAGTMNHDEGYLFLRMGRNLERSDMTTRIIDVRSASLLSEETPELRPFDNIQWMSVLKSMTGYQMYRREMQVSVRRADVLRFLMQSPNFPRSVLHCMGELESALMLLPHNEDVLRAVARLKRLTQEADVRKLAQSALHVFLDDLQLGLGDIHTEVANSYFLGSMKQSQAQTAEV